MILLFWLLAWASAMIPDGEWLPETDEAGMEALAGISVGICTGVNPGLPVYVGTLHSIL